MSATDELRRMLNERGVEWWQKKQHTCWKQGYEVLRAWEAPDGSLTLTGVYIYHLTPAQAIDATLGRGTCHIGRGTSGLMHVTTGHCSECGAEVVKPARYCPNCGRRVEP